MANDRRMSRPDIWAVIPVKDASLAKQRLADALSAPLRKDLALAMFQDVLDAVTAAPDLHGIAVVTADPTVAAIARRAGAETWPEGAHDGHTGAVTAAARRLAANTCALLTIPGDVPLVSGLDISRVLAAHPEGRALTIVPAWDELGSNTIVCSPADAVPLRFGPDSYFPHLAAARAVGLTPTIVRNEAIALDIDEPSDLIRFMNKRSATRSWKLLDERRAEWDHEASMALASQ
ncbi:MAG: 2-phospho-L-lactate guanylyltransferase [Xanthobacteraceae bacterium]